MLALDERIVRDVILKERLAPVVVRIHAGAPREVSRVVEGLGMGREDFRDVQRFCDVTVLRLMLADGREVEDPHRTICPRRADLLIRR